MKKKITWITFDTFIDCDISIVKELKKTFDITWILMFPMVNSRFKKEDFTEDSELNDVNLKYFKIKFRLRKPSTYLFWLNFAKYVTKTNPDVIYFNGDALLMNAPFFWALDKKKLIIAIHEGLITTNNKKVLRRINLARKLIIPNVRYINCFSNSQATFFSEKFPNNKMFVIPLALKDFGFSEKQQKEDDIVFFNFGRIVPKKNIDLLIEAACNIYEQGYRGFKIAIIGGCANWDYYLSKMRYPSIFITDIRSIDNSEIKDLFSEYHYLVLPYKVVSQSGPLKIAFNYNIPVVVSDQLGFTDEVVDGVNGFVFKTGEVKSLESVLKNAIDQHKDYDLLRNRMKTYTADHYSLKVIGDKYTSMFNKVTSAK
ncbi:glycosyltransferase family 4 protein [Oceanihabitans sediminis]|uniref:glycosyltransferase family 4 protein n=1 Tax=Oceanihabitans sediminis TaxID=1812012 RepID=UPI003A9406D5